MDRVQNVLQKLQELYDSKHPKSGIDLDLMLDYTRVLYADLLEWRKRVPQPAAPQRSIETPAAIKPGPGTPEDSQNDLAAQSDNTAATAVSEREDNPGTQEDDRFKSKAADNISDNTAATTADPDPKIIPAHEHSGISFEPPHLAEASPKEINDILEEEPPSKPQNGVTEKKAAAFPDMTQLFDHKSQLSRKDIRKEIGINDRYLYLNELFNSQKAIYEATIAKLNDMDSLEAAQDYIKNEIVTAYKWDEEEETVQDFYALLRKHFASR